jgi:O-antigen/teichoic acid export membrane protein
MARVTRNIVYNGTGQVASLLVGFFAIRIVYKRLGGDALGLIYFSQTFCAVLSWALTLGICETAVREVAAHCERDPEYIKDFIRTSSTFYWVGYTLLAAVAYMLAPLVVQRWLKLGSLEIQTAITVVRVLSIGSLLILPARMYGAMLTGLQRMGYNNLIDVAIKGTQQLGIFLIVTAHGSIFSVAHWIFGCLAAQVLAYLLVCMRFFSFRTMLPGFSLAVVKKNMGYAGHLMTISISSSLHMQTDRIIISKLLPLADVGTYNIARGFINQGGMITSAIANAVFPHFSALHGAGKTRQMVVVYKDVQDLICLATIPGFAAMPFAVIPLFTYLFDSGMAHLLFMPVVFLAIAQYMNGTLYAPYYVSLAAGRPDIGSRQNLLALLIVPPVSFVAVYYFGLTGAGLSWVVYHIFAYLYGARRTCLEVLGIPPRTWFVHVLRILGSAMLIYGGAWSVLAWGGSFSIPRLVAAYAAASVIYLGLALYLMSKELRLRIAGFLAPLLLKVRLAPLPD